MKRFLFGRGPVVDSILGRMALVVLYATACAILFTWLFLLVEPREPVLFKFGLLAASGLTAGFLARRQLSNFSVTLSFLTALVAEIVALATLNPITHGFIGMNLFGFYPSNPEWDGLLQFCVTGLTAWLALRAWAPAPARSARRASAPRLRNSSRRSSGRTRVATPKRQAAGSTRLSFNRLRQQTSQRLRSTFQSLAGIFSSPPRTAGSKRRGVAKKKATATRRRSGASMRVRRKRGVQVSSVEEHRCPYCLEPVVAHDPRGVKICEVCHTWHHADCWAVTGVCQVPHENP